MNAAGHDAGVSVDTVRRLVDSVSARLGSTSDARWIVAQAAGIAPRNLLSVLPEAVSPATVESVQAMTERRAAGEPLQYVLGSWSFRHLEIGVDARALIPRPETEQVVEVALEELRSLVGASDRRSSSGWHVVDLGTGSGAIALSLAVEATESVGGAVDGLEVWATDVSETALALAGENLARLAGTQPAAARVRLAQGSWFDALPRLLAGHLDLVVSNPPYVSELEWTALDPVIRDHEPRTALVPGATGLEALEDLVEQSRRWLRPGGRLVLELAPHQAATMATRAGEAAYVDVRLRSDLAGRPRTLVAVWPGG